MIARMRNRKSGLILGLAVVGVVAVVAAITLVPGIGRTAHASGVGGGGCVVTTTPACSFKGHMATTDFSSISSDACPIFTDAGLEVFETLQRPGAIASQTAFIFITQIDCNGILVEEASNLDPNTGVPNFTGSIQFGTGVTTGTMNGTATMFDNVSNTSFTSTFNLKWQGFGPTTITLDNSHIRGPGFIASNHFHGTDREAEASGTYTNADGSNLAASPTINADISDSSGGTVFITKP